MSTLKVGGIRGVSASSDAITVANDGTATGSTSSRLTTSPPTGFTHYIRFPSTTNSVIFSQQIELDLQGKAGRFAGKTVTVSWYARSESSNKMYVDA